MVGGYPRIVAEFWQVSNRHMTEICGTSTQRGPSDQTCRAINWMVCSAIEMRSEEIASTADKFFFVRELLRVQSRLHCGVDAGPVPTGDCAASGQMLQSTRDGLSSASSQKYLSWLG
ncbi:hypothetical protein IC762_31750 [Bradyrhizobium genosp. L]|uniref:hypothetical protein n=1 Tax=Bradyrhizobium genosp. L TaxID=83637 RepID=UPI0018A2BAB1|nr:hypothetical protein [Bradyrhizobium genosp. L]QPF84146.1 hypothetical protein IC762_31750 [Bradyrhizobium genosp. L]